MDLLFDLEFKLLIALLAVNKRAWLAGHLGGKMKKKFLLGSIVLMASCILSPTWAADWNFYGSARVRTFYDSVETGATTTKNLTHALQSNARIGARVKVSDTLTGRFEYGAGGGNANLRHLYGEWNFGPGKLLVGQTDSLFNYAISHQVHDTDKNMDSYGHSDAGRQPMIRLTFGDFKLAFVQPETSGLNLAASSQEVKLPKLEASYKLSFDSSYLLLTGGYQSYELTDTTTLRSYDVDSYVIALGGQVQFGSAYLGGDIWAGQNVKPYQFKCSPDGDPVVVGGNTLADNDSYGFLIVAGYKLNETFSFETGYGYVEAEVDNIAYVKDDTVAYYIQSTVTLADGVFFVPEIGRIDKGNTNLNAVDSDTTYAGIKWQINF